MSPPPDERPVTWDDPDVVARYAERSAAPGPRDQGERLLVDLLPAHTRRLVDLGCGDGRLAATVLAARPDLESVVVIDRSPPMLDRARRRFAGDPRIEIRAADLADPLDALGDVDAVVSALAIHHLEDDRKQSLFGEVRRGLRPGGLFADLDVVASATDRRHREFLTAIDRPADDPEDRLANVEDQLRWLHDAGFVEVDCLWRWRGFALLVGEAPSQ